MSYQDGYWKPYVPVAARRAAAAKEAAKVGKSGQARQPVRITGRAIAQSFWGKGWCTQLEAFSDFENRLPRGRTYVRNGCVCHLEIKGGRIEALVVGSSLYRVAIDIAALKPAAWKALQQKCSGAIGSLLELLQGRLSSQVMAIVADREAGLFPKPGEMKFECSCPDWADMCKHVAAVLYGVGNRLDQQPQLLFQLRGVDAEELIAASVGAPQASARPAANRIADDQLGAIFGIDMEEETAPAAVPEGRRTALTATKPEPAPKAPARSSGGKAIPPFRPSAKSIAALRSKLGLSVAEFAGRLSVSTASVQRWEASSGALALQARCLIALEKLHKKAHKDKR